MDVPLGSTCGEPPGPPFLTRVSRSTPQWCEMRGTVRHPIRRRRPAPAGRRCRSPRPSSARISSVCSPSAGRAAGERRRGAAEPRRVPGQAGPADDVVVGLLEEPDGDRVRVVGELGGREDHGERHPLGLEPLGRLGHRQVARRARSTRSMISAIELAVLDALGRSSRRAGRRSPSTPRPRHMPAKSASDGRRDDAPAVGEAHRPEAGDEARVLRAVRLEQHLVGGRVGPQERHDRVGHRQLDVLAARARARGRTARR